MRVVRWTGHAIGLAAFPAGITTAQPELKQRAFRDTVPLLLAAITLGPTPLTSHLAFGLTLPIRA
jgi:hypothetical protein